MNYQKELDDLTNKLSLEHRYPKLLIHSCCAPCSSYVLECLSIHFDITILYYNPNIYPEEEYYRRIEEQKRFLKEIPLRTKVDFIAGEYHPADYYRMIEGLEEEKEGGNRCFACYRLRLLEAAKVASDMDFEYFTTTLSISPHKNAAKLNEIGEEIAQEYKTLWLPSDFKKKNGYKRSIELSKEYNLYRQDYCGCIYSKRERELNG
jgi:epoxyqueuosine reductase